MKNHRASALRLRPARNRSPVIDATPARSCVMRELMNVIDWNARCLVIVRINSGGFMVSKNQGRMLSVLIASTLMLFAAAQISQAQGQGGGKDKKEQKKLEKEARKLADTAEDAEQQLGRNAVYCILAAHTGVGTAQALKSKYESLMDFPFGQFVAAVHMADRTDLLLDDILSKLQEGQSLGQIAKEADVNMGELRRGFGEFRSELARSITNPPTRDCFQSTL